MNHPPTTGYNLLSSPPHYRVSLSSPRIMQPLNHTPAYPYLSGAIELAIDFLPLFRALPTHRAPTSANQKIRVSPSYTGACLTAPDLNHSYNLRIRSHPPPSPQCGEWYIAPSLTPPFLPHFLPQYHDKLIGDICEVSPLPPPPPLPP